MKTLSRIGWWISAVLSSLLAGVLVGIVAFGPFHQTMWISLAVTLAVAAIWIVFWLRIDSAGVRWGLGLLPCLAAAGMAALALTQLYSMGQFAPLSEDRLQNFDRLTAAIGSAYPYLDEKGIDWDATVAFYRPQVEAAADDEAYRAVLGEVAASLNDCHVALYPLPRMVWFGGVREVEGQPVIVHLGDAARELGLAVGDVVLALNGKAVDEVIATLPPPWRSGSTPWNRRENALSYLLTLYDGAQSINVSVRKDDGNEQTVTLTLAAAEVYTPDASAEIPPLVWGKRLDSGMGYIHLGSNFGNRNGQDMTAQFDAALDELMDTPGLILDLRDNGGGNSFIASQIAGRFLSESFVYGREYYETRLPTRFWWKWSERRVDPRGERYAAPVLILTDATTVSSAEEFVISLVDAGRAITVGRTTAGGTGNPIRFQLPDDVAFGFSTGDLRRSDGSLLEGVGIVPAVPVQWTLDNVRSGFDPDIAAAEEKIMSKE